MSPIESVKTCMRKAFVFSGRASRSEFWWFYLLSSILRPILAELNATVGLIWSALVLIPTLAAGSRRLNDIKEGGGWLIFPIALVMTALGFAMPREITELQTDTTGLVLFLSYCAVAITAFALLTRPSKSGPNPQEVTP